MIFSSNHPAAATEKWYQRALVYVGFTVVIIAVFIALIAIGGQSGFSLQQRLWQGVGLLVACGMVAGGYLTLVRAEAQRNGDGNADGVVPATIVFDAICFTVGGLVIISFANPANPRQWAATIMWALACLAIGAMGGFLFGIPRSRREGRPAATSNPPSQTPPPGGAQPDPVTTAATNVSPDTAAPQTGSEQTKDGSDPSPIEQISDWLTKIIVGLGLANLRDLPKHLDAWARYVAMGIGSSATPSGGTDGSGASFALGVILYFLILGFMACYILTQIFLRNLINKSNT